MILRQPLTGSVSVSKCNDESQRLSLPVDTVLLGYLALVGMHNFWTWQAVAERHVDVIVSGGPRTALETLPLLEYLKNRFRLMRVRHWRGRLLCKSLPVSTLRGDVEG